MDINYRDLYLSFTASTIWSDALALLRINHPFAADVVGEYGIGDKLLPDGSYDYESGQLLENIPEYIRYAGLIGTAYFDISSIAQLYSRFAINEICRITISELVHE